ncbi:MAG: aldo/keto reductase [Thermoanaerobaculia bacterium]
MDARTRLTLHTGRRMPFFGLGTWLLTRDTAATVEEALRLGYRMIDTAVDYGSEEGIGEALARTSVSRDEIYLVDKVEEDEDAYDATRARLATMKQEFADLILIHRPPSRGAGVDLWRGLIRARADGLTRDIGVSNYTTTQIDELIDATGEVPVVNQIEWSPFGWSREMLDYTIRRGIMTQAYSPLTRAERLGDATLGEIAREAGRSPAQVLVRWNLQLGTVPIPKANQLAHVRENLGAFDFELSDAQMERLGALNERYSSLGTLAYA